MTPAANHLLRALYLHALAPSTANQDAVRAAGAALDTETARALNAPRVQLSSGNVFRDLGRPDADAKFEAAKEAAAGLPCHTDALPIAEAVSRKILDRAAFGLRKYGVSLDDAGHSPVALLTHLQEELMDGANYVEAFKRALMATTAPVEPPHASAPDVAGIAAAVRRQALLDALAAVERVAARDSETAAAVRDLFYRDAAAPVEPPHAAAPVLATLTPEPTEAVLGRAGEALAGSLPVYVLAGTGRHPYGDDAWHMETDGVARLFPSKEAAQRWLAAMGRAPV